VPARFHLFPGKATSAFQSDRAVVAAPSAREWPYLYPLEIELPPGPVQLYVPHIHEAFVNHQTAGTQLVTTQASFLVQAWLDAIGDRDVIIVATADRDSLAKHAPEILAGRGVFAEAGIDESIAPDLTPWAAPPASTARQPVAHLLATAMRVDDPLERLRLCVTALEAGRTPPVLLAAASTCMEVNDFDAAARELDDALKQAPEWAAAHFERGKLWLRVDDMERASESFQRAAGLMPRFGSAWANLGAALGELDRPQEALEAFSRALECDPTSPQAFNNVGVVRRELGKLAESEAAFRHVIELSPEMAFGHYNLGHTLFLQGRYQVALGAYVEGQKRDSAHNPVQASRLAMCRLACGDTVGALRDLRQATNDLPRDYRRQLLEDTRAIAWALLTHRPDLPGWQHVHDWLASELAR